MAGITLRSVCKSFGSTPAVTGVSLDVKSGEFLALVGPSGCGKSTLLRIIAGLEDQDAGEVLLDGRRIDGLPPKARDIAMVFQSYALYPHMTAAENIAAPLRMRRLNGFQRLPLVAKVSPRARDIVSGIDRDVAAVAEGLGIAPLLARKPRQLSGGQRQRVALGRAMVRAAAGLPHGRAALQSRCRHCGFRCAASSPRSIAISRRRSSTSPMTRPRP